MTFERRQTWSVVTGISSELGLLRLLIISYCTVTVTVYGYRSDTAVYGYCLTLVNTVNTVHFVKLRYLRLFRYIFAYGYVRLCTVMYGYRGYRGYRGYNRQ